MHLSYGTVAIWQQWVHATHAGLWTFEVWVAITAPGIYVISFCVNTTLIGCATVFLLLSSSMARSIAAKQAECITFCHWALILAAVLCPLMWLGTPKDFWPVAVGAMLSTAVACVLTVMGVALDAPAQSHQSHNHSPPSLRSFFLAFGTITFSFGGASTFPTFQNDMRDRTQFPKAVLISFIGLLLLYLPVSVGGYQVYGTSLSDNILENLPEGPLRLTIEVLVSIHLFFAFLLVINTPAQEIEEILKIPRGFSLWRIAVRTGLLLVVVFAAESIPHFGKILNLIGGSTIALMTYVFPPIFYICLSRMEGPWQPRRIPKYQLVFLVEIMAVGVVGGAIATYSALESITAPDSFTPPCYVNITANTGL
ncbi:hypothetical protein LAZ67_23000819 [Cordylochernes scorpioides]|uniref:Amino acid transporter transmembrane domain-containing protein n=1 Tax=Cordylochernes scorpioides TaxID=51811 RepID=A0ABY6LQL2_9ARAC|nr:hypothetical protein LAZ67_23000819 [Cordylochernes scorpioides]